MNPGQFGKMVRELRKKKKLTQVQLAKKLGLKSQSSISEIEAGITTVNGKKARKLAKALGVKLEQLMGGEVER